MESKILDSNIINKELGFRKLAISIEVLPIISIIIYTLIVDNYLLLILLPSIMSVVYLISGWYLFKGSEFTSTQIFTTVILGFYLLYVGITYIYVIQNWIDGERMTILGLIVGFFIILGLIYRYKKKQLVPLEYRFSLKLLSRVLLFQLLLIYILIIN